MATRFKFELKIKKITVREQEFTVRELTHKERTQFVQDATADRYRGPALLCSIGCAEPKATEEEAGEWPADVTQEVASAIMELSGMNSKSKEENKDAVQKEPVA